MKSSPVHRMAVYPIVYALVYALALCGALAPPALASARDDSKAIDEIVVTGSLISGTPEDSALPVDVYTVEDLRQVGAPTALEFAKSLTAQGPITGAAHYFGGAVFTGNVTYNLRGIGPDKTLSLFNGRRIDRNTAIIPQIALQRVEILKDGAAVTYGADATGGVVNFITRDVHEGLAVDAAYTHVDGSRGDINMAMLGGAGGGETKLLWAAEWSHRSELDADQRRFGSLPYGVNPAPWSTQTNLAPWFAHGPLPATPTASLHPLYSAPVGEFGPLLGAAADFTQSSCEAVGGIYQLDAFGNPGSCSYGYLPYYNLVEDNDIYRLYGQLTTALGDSAEAHLRVAFARVHTPHAYGSPSQPVVRGPARHPGLVAQFYVPRSNPFWDEFALRGGLDQSPCYNGIPGFCPPIAGATAITYRAFAHGGNGVFAEDGNHSTPSEIDTRYWHLSTGIGGQWDNGSRYDLGLTYNYSVAWQSNPDIIGYRLQEALNGFGGPDCNAADLDLNRYGTQNAAAAGQNGCQWFNPFASNFAGQPVLGLANPAYGGPAYENPPDLVRWLFDKRVEQTTRHDITLDLVFNGETPLALPGGNIAWGAGVQWRGSHSRERVNSPFNNGSQPCQWPASEGQTPLPASDPGFTGCDTSEPGPFQFFGPNPPDRLQQHQQSVFAEFNVPVADTVTVTAAARYEEFDGELDATVYKVAGKWEATEQLAFRGSYGTNYQAPGLALTPGAIYHDVNSYSVASNAWRGASTVIRTDIEPETATVWNVGTLWQSPGFTADSDFRLTVDYFNIETEDELGLLASANQIADAVFHLAGASATAPKLADCAHPLANRITFNGSCIQGVTTAMDFASVTTEFGNGPSQRTAGFDIRMSYGFPFYAGELRVSLAATKIETLESAANVIDGYRINNGDDRLGKLNFAVVAFAAPEWRGNLHVNYARDRHNVRLVLNYISGVDDERFFNGDGSPDLNAMTPGGFQPGTNDPYGPSDFGVKGDDWITADIHYTVSLPGDMLLSASIVNITDKDPPASRQELGYDPRMGNPLGRTVEIGFQKRF